MNAFDMRFLRPFFTRRPTGTSLPDTLPNHRWWVIERRMENRQSGERFRIFEAVIAPDKATARAHLAAADARLDAVLMKQAIRRGDVMDAYDWQPVSRELAVLTLAPVRSEEEIAALDPALLQMLQEHAFFVADFQDSPDMAVGGGVYPDPLH